MEILEKAVMVVDYDKDEVSKQSKIPQSFDKYITDMIKALNKKTDVKHYESRSKNATVVVSILEIQKELGSKDFKNIFEEKTDVIAKKLKEVEKNVQDKIAKMNQKVRVGTFIQVFYKENSSVYYFLGKTQHTSFIDEYDYSSKKGFPDDKFNIWRYCIFDITDTTKGNIDAVVFTDHEVKYWANDFLELDELSSDDTNTKVSFEALDFYLKKHIKPKSPHDFLVLRNDLIHYYKSNKQIVYSEMVDNVFQSYTPSAIDSETYNTHIQEIEKLPEKKKFDTNFITNPAMINAKIRQIYDIQAGIQLRILEQVNDIQNEILSYENKSGEKYIVIKTDNLETFRTFKKASQ